VSEITGQEHKDRHELLHQHLDELTADFIKHTAGSPSRTTVLELMQWSNEQCKNPTEETP
jgi:hypothetical protein